jgi:serine phosphatase RsbU (regulator of sigma subunit)/pSer/pThr/pTyr-binding forkhead associated (FHA) protein
MAALQTIEGLESGQVFPLEKDSIILGRHPECDIVLDSGAVSRQHARVFQDGGRFYVQDLHSRNGTYLNGKPVVQRQLLHEHDRLAICDIVFAFHHGEADLDLPQSGPEDPTSLTTTIMVDDELIEGNSTVMSRLDISSGSSSLRLEVNPETKLRALMEISRNLGRALSVGEVLPNLLESLFSIFVQADRGFVVLRDPVTGRLMPKAVRHRSATLAGKIRLSRTIINGVMHTKEAILSADAASDARFDMAESIADFQIRSMMCAPLVNTENQVLGVIQIDALDPRKRFSREDLDVLASVACQAAIAVENAQLHERAVRERELQRELNIAHEVLRRLLPESSPEVSHYDFFEYYEPANQLGGDYYDYVPLSGGRLAVVVADVSGKGIPASLLMARLSADVRYCLASNPVPADAVGHLNRVFCGSGWDDRFVTLVLSVLDPARHELTIVNAGHLPPLLRHEGGVSDAVCDADSRMPLGVDREEKYVQTVRPLKPGDCLALYTDGITEAMDEQDELYGFDRLRSCLAAAPAETEVLGQAVLDDVKLFAGGRPQSDDICLVCVGRKT